MSFHAERIGYVLLLLSGVGFASALALAASWFAWNGISWKLARRARARGALDFTKLKREASVGTRRLWRRDAA